MLGRVFKDQNGEMNKDFVKVYGDKNFIFNGVFSVHEMGCDELLKYNELEAYSNDEKGVEFLVDTESGKIVQTISVDWSGEYGINMQTA